LTIRLLNDRRRYQEALTRIDREIPSTSFPWDVVLLFERARALEGTGKPSEAARAYSRVAALWARADSALQPFVKASQAGASRLSGKN
jgi:hypothetical protein